MRTFSVLMIFVLASGATPGLHAQVTVDFIGNGTFVAPFFEKDGLLATSVTGVGLSDPDGIGVAGGVDDYITEAGETLVVLLPYMSNEVIVDWGGALIFNFLYEYEAFRNGVSLGTVQLNAANDPHPINLNAVFDANAINAFTITGISGGPTGDHLGSITFDQLPTPATVDSFSPTGFGFSVTASEFIAPSSALFYEIIYDGCAPLTINTFGTMLDTEIALFDAVGLLLDENDDAGGLQSELVFFDLQAGTYYLSVSLFESVFFDGFGVSSFSGDSGPVTVNVTTTQRPGSITVDFTDDGTFVTPLFQESGLIATSANGVGLLQLGGIGAAGGLDDYATEVGETLIVSLPYLSSEVEIGWFGNCLVYEYEVFRNGVSLGTVQLNSCDEPNPFNLNAAIGANAIDAFTITGIGGAASGDFLSTVSFDPAPASIGTFFPSGTGFFDTVTTFVDVEGVVFFEIVYDGAATLSINTVGTELDTEIGFYNICGVLLAENDDAIGLQSELIFENLDAGTYFVAVGLFDTEFGDDFATTSFSGSSGPVTVNLRTFDTILLGDVNLDGVVNLLDVDPFIVRVRQALFKPKPTSIKTVSSTCSTLIRL